MEYIWGSRCSTPAIASKQEINEHRMLDLTGVKFAD
jgi:hypothetical protein